MPRFFASKKPAQRIMPQHIGIILDGNGRWAKKRGLPRKAGHSKGAETFRTITQYCQDIGIKYLTVYAFSTENWKRPQDEVNAIMDLLRDYLHNAFSHKDDNIRSIFIGDRQPLDEDIRDLMAQAEEGSRDATGLTVNVALNYGGRQEIVQAAQKLARQVKEGNISPEDIDEERFASALYTAGQPDPDLIIRPSGEYRISNFLLWQCAYAEFVIMDTLWPDFTSKHLDEAIEIYNGRNRRFGGI